MTEQQKKDLMRVYGNFAGVTARTDLEEDLVQRIYRVLRAAEPDLAEPLERTEVVEPLRGNPVGPVVLGMKILLEHADKTRYTVSLPDPHRRGEFYEDGPLSYEEGVEYLQRWYGPTLAKEAAKVLLVQLPDSGE